MFLRTSGETIAPALLLFRTNIPRQPHTMPPILNCLFRTAADTCHTMRTIFPPHRFPVIHMDIAQRTHICTFSAGDTGVCCGKLLCMNKHRIKDIVDNAAVYFIFYGKMTLRELFPPFIRRAALSIWVSARRMVSSASSLPGVENMAI